MAIVKMKPTSAGRRGMVRVFLSGCLFLLISALGLRLLLIIGIPQTLRAGTSAGIGLFLAIIGLSNAGIVVASPKTLVTLEIGRAHV